MPVSEFLDDFPWMSEVIVGISATCNYDPSNPETSAAAVRSTSTNASPSITSMDAVGASHSSASSPASAMLLTTADINRTKNELLLDYDYQLEEVRRIFLFFLFLILFFSQYSVIQFGKID
tara:strand:- start:291 stop:653 length:363 start_codon:yes stop_codon:yes gene_type:complete